MKSKASAGVKAPAGDVGGKKDPRKKAPASAARLGKNFVGGAKGGLTAAKVSRKLKMAK